MQSRVDRTVNVNGQEIAFYVIRPTNQTLRDADRYRTKVWTQCKADKIPTKKQLAKMMVDSGDWSKEKEDREAEITMEIIRSEKELYQGGDTKGRKKPKLSDGRDLAIKIRQLRVQLRDLIAGRLALEENSAENLADNARFDYLVAHSTFYSDTRRVYKDFDDYNSRSADELAFAAAQILAEMVYNIDAGFEKNLPENVFLSKYGLVDEELSLIDPNTGHLIDIEGNRIDKEGYLLDDDGNRIDKDGNKITEDGSYEMVEYENDLVIKKPARSRKKKPQPEAQTTES